MQLADIGVTYRTSIITFMNSGSVDQCSICEEGGSEEGGG